MFTYTIEKAGAFANGQQVSRDLIHAKCWSSDTKPTGFADGSDCFEVNPSTGEMKLYFYDQTNEAWVEGA